MTAVKLIHPTSNSGGSALANRFWLNVEETPNLEEWAAKCDEAFFYRRLKGRIMIEWNSSMTSTAGLCFTREMFGELRCKIKLSKPLLLPLRKNNFIETLIHEMIHAYVNLVERPPKREVNKGHGTFFTWHQERINRMTGLNISVFHDYYEEVNNTRKYWWACDGECRLWPPYYGLIKKRHVTELSARQLEEHGKYCSGTFYRVRVPTPKPVKIKSGKTKAASRPALVLRRSLLVPSPIANRNVYIARNKVRIRPPTPRTAMQSYQYLVKHNFPMPKLKPRKIEIKIPNPVEVPAQPEEKLHSSKFSLVNTLDNTDGLNAENREPQAKQHKMVEKVKKSSKTCKRKVVKKVL